VLAGASFHGKLDAAMDVFEVVAAGELRGYGCGEKQRHFAVVGDAAAFEQLVKSNMDVLVLQDSLLNTPLHIAVQRVGFGQATMGQQRLTTLTCLQGHDALVDVIVQHGDEGVFKLYDQRGYTGAHVGLVHACKHFSAGDSSSACLTERPASGQPWLAMRIFWPLSEPCLSSLWELQLRRGATPCSTYACRKATWR